MGWGWLARQQRRETALIASAQAPVVAAAQIVSGPAGSTNEDSNNTPTPRTLLYRTPETWQREIWDFMDTLGEFRQGITWKANMMSRVRLRAARRLPGQDEPEIVDNGTANDIVAELGGGVGGQSRMMSGFAVYLDGPGECYLVGETMPSGKNKWYPRSIDELRPAKDALSLKEGEDDTGPRYEIAEWANKWRLLPPDSFVVRVHRPHWRYHYVADSPARGARAVMRELELLNRHIAAQYLSRLASAGVLVLPLEVSMPVRPEFADAADPFVAEWIEIAAEAIKTPGSAAATIPIPIRVPAEFVQYVQHIDFTLSLDRDIVAKRDSALSRLAIELDMPPEALLGTKDVNHWSAWLIDEQGVKIHVSPTVEVACDALTVGFLAPMLKAAIEAGATDVGDVDDWVVWYDASELILRPDRSTSATEVYGAGALKTEALRRENGFDESDAPDDEELRRIILIHQALTASGPDAFAAMEELGMKTSHDPGNAVPAPSAPGAAPGAAPSEQNGPPAQEPGAPTPTGNPPNAAAAKALIAQQARAAIIKLAGLPHVINIAKIGAASEILHPNECADHLASCPVFHAVDMATDPMPGSPGTYECWLDDSGKPHIGSRVIGDTSAMLRSELHTQEATSQRSPKRRSTSARSTGTHNAKPGGTD